MLLHYVGHDTLIAAMNLHTNGITTVSDSGAIDSFYVPLKRSYNVYLTDVNGAAG